MQYNPIVKVQGSSRPAKKNPHPHG